MSVVEDIKQRIDIVDLVSQHVTLKRAGRGYTALCPFHTEKTPSFHVDPARQSWHCFGACGTGGDVFSFVMKKEACEFREALRILSEQTGVALDTRRDPQDDARRGRLYEANEAAAAHFQAELRSAGPQASGAETARAYIAERALTETSLEKFQIGYAPNSWDSLAERLTSRGFSAEELIAAGLAVEGERGAYDRFRHRLMFPIRDERGRIAGFGGRALPGEAVGSGGAGSGQAKYVNTPQSPIFDKGALLYGLDLARDAIRSEGRAVIVEGYMDTIAAHEHGYANVVASMGTALTERQVGLLKRHTRDLVLALDADTAGSEATLRGVQVVADAADHEAVPVPNWRGIIRQQEVVSADIRVMTLPAGRDPDDVIRAEPELWARLVSEAKPVLDYLFDAAAARHDLTQPRERSVAAAELTPMVAAISDRVVQSHYLQRLARMVQVDEATLRLELRTPQRKTAPRARPDGQDDTPPRATVRSVHDKKEEFCIALLFRYPELRSEAAGVDPGLFGRSENRALFEAWIGSPDAGEPFEGTLTPDLRPQYERICSIDLPLYDDETLVRAFRTTVWGIEQQRLQLAKRASAAVLADMPVDDSALVAERARTAWQTGERGVPGEEADPASAFIHDMEAGLRVHQRILDQRRGQEDAAAGEVVDEQR